MAAHCPIATPGWAPPATPDSAGSPNRPAQRPDDLLLGIWRTGEPGLLVGPFHFTMTRLMEMQRMMQYGNRPGAGKGQEVFRKALSRKGRATTSVYKGVNLHSRCNRWDAHIWDSRQVHVGCFMCEIQAAIAYDLMAIKVRGAQTCNTNFPASMYQHEVKELDQIPKCDLLRTLRKSAARMNAALDLLAPGSPTLLCIRAFMQQPPSTAWFTKDDELKGSVIPAPSASAIAPTPATRCNAPPSATSAALLPLKRPDNDQPPRGTSASPSPPAPLPALPCKRALDEQSRPTLHPSPFAPAGATLTPHPTPSHSPPPHLPAVEPPTKRQRALPSPYPMTPQPTPSHSSLPYLTPAPSSLPPPASACNPTPLRSLPSGGPTTPLPAIHPPSITQSSALHTNTYDSTLSWLSEHFPEHTSAPPPLPHTSQYPSTHAHPDHSHPAHTVPVSEPSSPHISSAPRPAASSASPTMSLSPQAISAQDTYSYSGSDASTASCCTLSSPPLDPPAAAFYAHQNRSSGTNPLTSPRAPHHPASPPEVFSPRAAFQLYSANKHAGWQAPPPTHPHFLDQHQDADPLPTSPYIFHHPPTEGHWAKAPTSRTLGYAPSPDSSSILPSTLSDPGLPPWTTHPPPSTPLHCSASVPTQDARRTAAHPHPSYTTHHLAMSSSPRVHPQSHQPWQQDCTPLQPNILHPNPPATPLPDDDATREMCQHLLHCIDGAHHKLEHACQDAGVHTTPRPLQLPQRMMEQYTMPPQYAQQAPQYPADLCSLPSQLSEQAPLHHPQGYSLSSRFSEQAPSHAPREYSKPPRYPPQTVLNLSEPPSQPADKPSLSGHYPLPAPLPLLEDPWGSNSGLPGGLPALFSVDSDAWGQPTMAASPDAVAPQLGGEQGWLGSLDMLEELLGDC